MLVTETYNTKFGSQILKNKNGFGMWIILTDNLLA